MSIFRKSLFVVFAIIALFKREYLALFFWLALAAFFLLPRIAHLYPDALPGINEDFTATFWPVLLIVVGAGLQIINSTFFLFILIAYFITIYQF